MHQQTVGGRRLRQHIQKAIKVALALRDLDLDLQEGEIYFSSLIVSTICLGTVTELEKKEKLGAKCVVKTALKIAGEFLIR